jgi:hypothetical protein
VGALTHVAVAERAGVQLADQGRIKVRYLRIGERRKAKGTEDRRAALVELGP